MTADDVRSGPAPTSTPEFWVLDRVRAWNVSTWRHGRRIAEARLTIDRLAELERRHLGAPPRAVPDAGVHALADQLRVLSVQALSSGVRPALIDAELADLAHRLGLPPRRAGQ